MSRIGRAPIEIPAGVEVTCNGNVVTVKGPKGTLSHNVHPDMTVTVEGNTIHVTRPSDDKLHRSLHGLTRTLIHNMVIGVTEGFSKTLEINGVGYRAVKEGQNLVMHLGLLAHGHRVRERGHPDRCPEPEPGHYQGYRQGKGRPGLQQKCARSVRPSRTRARASSTITSISAAKKARPARSNWRCA